MTGWNEGMDNSLRESVLPLQMSTTRHSISAEACRKRWTWLHKQRLVEPAKQPRKDVLDISDVDFSQQTSPSIFGGVTTPSYSLKDTFQKMDEKVAELLPEMPEIEADDQGSDEEAVPLDFRTAMIENKVVIQAKPLVFKTDEEIMEEELELNAPLEVGKSGALQPQNYEAFLNTIKQTSFPEDDASVTVIQPEVDLEKELSMIDLPCNLYPSLNNDLKAPKATVSPKPLILRRNSEDRSPKKEGTPKKEAQSAMSLDSILAAQGTSIEALLEGEEGLDLGGVETGQIKEGNEEEEIKENKVEKEKKQEGRREGGRHVERTIERIRKRSHSRSKTPPRQNGESKPEKDQNYYKTARLRATLAEESDDEDDKFFLESRKNTRENLQLPEEKVWRDWESMGTYDSIYGKVEEEETKKLNEERKELEEERDQFLATFIVPGQKRPGKPGGPRKPKKEKKAEPRKAPEWEEKARQRREQLRAAKTNQQLVFRHETKEEIEEDMSGAINQWANALS